MTDTNDTPGNLEKTSTEPSHSPKKYCGKCGITHTALMCFNKPRKHPRKLGKHAKRWLETRQEWIKRHPTEDGYWYCHYCGAPLNYETLTLDHKIPRSKAPHLRYTLSNLVACCYKCNTQKGSKTDKEYLLPYRQFASEP